MFQLYRMILYNSKMFINKKQGNHYAWGRRQSKLDKAVVENVHFLMQLIAQFIENMRISPPSPRDSGNDFCFPDNALYNGRLVGLTDSKRSSFFVVPARDDSKRSLFFVVPARNDLKRHLFPGK